MAPSMAVMEGASAFANCISFTSDWRRASTLGFARSGGAAAAIMARNRFARGSSGMAAPVNQGSVSWWWHKGEWINIGHSKDGTHGSDEIHQLLADLDIFRGRLARR